MVEKNKSEEYYKRLEWASKIKTRDKYRCKFPGCKAKRNLQAHHITPWRTMVSLRYDVNNGITLCKECHAKIKNCEYAYAQMFREIVNATKKNTGRH